MNEEHGHVTGTFGGCHRAEGFISGIIMLATSWPWRWFKPSEVSSHTSIGFIYLDGYREIFEAREGATWRGPIPVSKVEAWVARKPKKRRFTMYDVPDYLVGRSAARRKWQRSQSMKGVWTYSLTQLPRMGIRKYLPFLPLKPTPNQVVCSEAACIILAPEVNIPAMLGKSSPDRVTPYDFERAMQLITAERPEEYNPVVGLANVYED